MSEAKDPEAGGELSPPGGHTTRPPLREVRYSTFQYSTGWAETACTRYCRVPCAHNGQVGMVGKHQEEAFYMIGSIIALGAMLAAATAVESAEKKNIAFLLHLHVFIITIDSQSPLGPVNIMVQHETASLS